MIVLEGPDGGGKTTLADQLHGILSWPIVNSKGPPADQEELLTRIDTYRKMGKRIIFDRHPVISNTIYGKIAPRPEIPQPMIDQFYFGPAFIIYCRSTDPRRAIPKKDFDTEELIKTYTENYEKLVWYYDEWALKHANYIWRIHEPKHPLIAAVRSFAMSVKEPEV